jgi:MoxR-like ATPase
LPTDETLNALLDRFLVRIECGYVDTDRLEEVLEAGWQLAAELPQQRPEVTPAEIAALQQMARQVDIGAIRRQYVGLIHTLRNTGINVSDRRAVRIQNLIAASAVLSGRTMAIPADLWVLRYVWDTREQADVLTGIVDNAIRDEDKSNAHPRAFNATTPDPETVLAEVRTLNAQWSAGNLTPAAQSVLRDKLRYIQSRTAWISNAVHKDFIEKEIDDLWSQILKTA